MRKWMLPEQIDDILPAEAERLESLRRTLLDHFRDHGYRLVQPPLIEHLDSLLTGTGRDLELQTFKLTDPLSGRLLGVRADMTPQVARIDAHLLNEPGVTRLCYAGSVLRTVATGVSQSREVLNRARAQLPDTPSIAVALTTLETLAQAARDRVEALHIDLADLRGYHYQSGASFSVFTAGEPNAIGRGERYDGIGKAFGRARPAT
ncbi:MAG: hypothetical protein E6H46_08905, partial [Betaproteobacteria bacterium]